MNYLDEIAIKIAEACGDPDVDRIPKEEARLYHIYALLALTTGAETTLENVHDAWAAWVAINAPTTAA